MTGAPPFAVINSQGLVEGIIRLMTTQTAADGVIDAGGNIYRLLPDGVEPETIVAQYIYVDGFIDLGPKPGEHYFKDAATASWKPDIDHARQIKSDALNEACTLAIVSGFDSNALGSVYHYPAKPQDQSNLTASVTASLIPSIPAEWVTPFWCSHAGVWSYQLHTAAQIQQVGMDGKAAIVAALTQNAVLQAQLVAATTLSEVFAIEWP